MIEPSIVAMFVKLCIHGRNLQSVRLLNVHVELRLNSTIVDMATESARYVWLRALNELMD